MGVQRVGVRLVDLLPVGEAVEVRVGDIWICAVNEDLFIRRKPVAIRVDVQGTRRIKPRPAERSRVLRERREHPPFSRVRDAHHEIRHDIV